MAIDLTDTSILSLWSRRNQKQGRFLIPANAVANEPGLLFLGNVDGSGTVGNGIVIWADNTGAIRYHTDVPTNEDADGTVITGAGSGALAALSNLASVAINTSLISDTDNTDDLGSSSKEWKDLYVDGVGYIDDARLDVAQLGGATNYINVAAGGVTTMAGTATIDGVASGNLLDKSAAEVVTGAWDFTTGGLEIKEDNLKLGFGAAGITDSYILFDGTDLIFYDANVAGTVTLSQLQSGTTLNPVVSGDLSIAEGKFNWTDSVDETAAAWSFANTGAGSDIDITSSATTGEVIDIIANAITTGTGIRITADAMANGTGILVDCDGGVGSTGFYFRGYDGSENDIAIGDNGEINIKGAAATDMITVDAGHILATAGNITATLGNIVATAGNVVITDGNLDMNEGKVEVDSTADEISYIKRNNATGTGPVFEIEESNAAGGVALLVDSDHTGAADAMQITYAGTEYGLNITGVNTAGSGLYLAGPASQTASLAYIDGAAGSGYVGASNIGMLHLENDGVLVAGSSLLRVSSTGANTAASYAVEIETTGAYTNSTDGAALKVLHSGTAASGTVYAVAIDSANDQALHVIRGLSVFDETVTCTGGVSIEDSASGVLTLGAANELTIQNDGTTSKIIVATDALTVGASATNYTQFSTAGLQTMAGSAQPTQNIYIPAQSFSLLTGSGTLAIPTGCKYSGWNMDPASDESYSTTFYVPEDWNAAAVTATIYWCTSDTNTNDVIFNVNTSPFAENEDTAVGHTNTDSVTDTACSATAYDLNVTAAIAIAANTEWAAGDLIVLNINRDADNTLDTNAADAFLIGVKITYSADHI